jgi:adenylate kinase family enzyme
MSFKRTVVVGTSGSGKSTFSREISSILNVPHIELDSIFWKPDWESVPEHKFIKDVRAAIDCDSWIIDGNYSAVRSEAWSRATSVVWLSLPFPVIFLRLLKRTLRRSMTGETCCNGNKESLRTALCSRDSVLLWAIRSHKQYEREYSSCFAAYPNAQKYRLTNSKGIELFMGEVRNAA